VTISSRPAADAADRGGRLPRNETLDLDDDQRAARVVGHLRSMAEVPEAPAS
jgi:4-carboxymuconolactone decarboxylase